MSNNSLEHARPPSPPPAPPLPPQRYGGFAATALARLAQPFGYGSRPPSANGHRPSDPRPSRLNVQRSSSPVSSRSVTHRTGLPIASLDVSPDRTHAVLAGRDILKTIQVSETACAEDFNLRTNIVAYAATHEASRRTISARHKDQLVANDVKWSHGGFSTTIATAAAHGLIIIYDINRAGVETARLHEHARQVHRLGFNPHQGAKMLSGSQDGTIRMWDLRDLSRDRSVLTCQSREKYTGNSEGIRDLRWSPTDGTAFAVGTDNGVVQHWDIRQGGSPLLKITAHEKTCHSIDWHPDGKYLVSGGADKNIRVWDALSSNRRIKPCWEIRAPQAVLHVRWRPACWSPNKQNSAAWKCTQLATSYDQQDPRIHVWDFNHPYIPSQVLDKYDTPATALLWHSESLLWSVGSVGIFTQTDMNFAPKTMDQRSPNTLDIAADGKILFFSQKREQRRRSIEDVIDQLNQQSQRRSSTGGQFGSSHSTAQDSSESLSSKIRPRKHPGSLQPTKSLAGTPPSAGSGGPVLGLDASLEKGKHQSSQVAGIGYIEGLFDTGAFQFLARHYRAHIHPRADYAGCALTLAEAFRTNSTLAARVSQHRLAQSWQILALAVEKELLSRANRSYEQRNMSTSQTSLRSDELRNISTSPTSQTSPRSSEQNNRLIPQVHQLKTMPLPDHNLLSKNPAPRQPSSDTEHVSNMTTPLARPIPDSLSGPSAPEDMEYLQLPDSVWDKQPLSATVSGLAKMTSPKSPHKSHHLDLDDEGQPEDSHEERNKLRQSSRQLPSDTDLADMDRQMAERRAAMGNYRAAPRPLLRLDDPIEIIESGLNAQNSDRHDSNESFQLFSASTDSSHRATSLIGSFESYPESQKSTSTPDLGAGTTDLGDDGNNVQDESVIVFEDEAQLCPPGSPSVSPPNVVPTPPEKLEKEEIATSLKTSNYRPDDSVQPMVHHEEMEIWPCAASPSTDKPPIESRKYIPSDFLPSQQEPQGFTPWTATAMFEPLINFHTYKLYDAQLPAYILLNLAPYISYSIPYERVMLILLQYHSQLFSLELYAQAAELRKHAHPEYPELADHGLYQITPGGPWCTVCQRPSKGTKPKYCERCKQPWGQCPVCNGKGPSRVEKCLDVVQAPKTFVKKPKAGDVLWGWCRGCGHGGHTGCLRIWWELEESEGACPTLGCMCDCMPGTRRDDIVKRLEEDRKPMVVNKDEWKVSASPAAQKARALVSGPPAGKGLTSGLGAGRGAMSLGAAGRSGSSGKKVRIVAPEEEGRNDSEGDKGDDRTSAWVP